MKLTWGERFWPEQLRDDRSGRRLTSDAKCDVLVVGAGVTGAVLADALVAEGLDVIVVDKRQPGCGSTSASTALLLYELDTPLRRLIGMIGRPTAERVYRMGVEAIERIERISADLPDDCGFSRHPSVYLASEEKHVSALREEFECRRSAGLRVELLNSTEIASRFSFSRPAAILSRDAAQIDPLRFTRSLLGRATTRGVRLFSDTCIDRIESRPAGIRAFTKSGPAIEAAWVIHATGYEAAEYVGRQIAEPRLTYAMASEPVDSFAGWWEQCLIWETARPYLYLRTLPDGRIMIGGEDDPGLRFLGNPARLDRKRQVLQRRFAEFFPAIPLRPAAAWAGVFETTRDGLPYIGPHPRFPHTLFALGFGGNGMTFAVMAAKILCDVCLGKRNDDLKLFRFDRHQ